MSSLTTKNLVLFSFLGLVAAFALGRYSVKSINQTAEISKEEQINKDKESHSTTTVVELPNGEKHTTTTTDIVSHTDVNKREDSTTTTQVNFRRPLNVSLLVSTEVSNIMNTPNYGISVTKEVFAMMTVGIFGFQNGTVGLSIGSNF